MNIKEEINKYCACRSSDEISYKMLTGFASLILLLWVIGIVHKYRITGDYSHLTFLIIPGPILPLALMAFFSSPHARMKTEFKRIKKAGEEDAVFQDFPTAHKYLMDKARVGQQYLFIKESPMIVRIDQIASGRGVREKHYDQNGRSSISIYFVINSFDGKEHKIPFVYHDMDPDLLLDQWWPFCEALYVINPKIMFIKDPVYLETRASHSRSGDF